MAKKKKSDTLSEDLALGNLAGFVKKGARVSSRDFVSTGHFELDFALISGKDASKINFEDFDPKQAIGLPLGRLIEFAGKEGSGKSSTALRVVGNAQKMGHKCIWFDTEHSFEESLAELNGVDLDELYYSELCDYNDVDKILNAEEVLDAINQSCKQFDVIVLDSVANLVPATLMNKDASNKEPATLARILSEQLKKTVQYAAKYNVLLIFINQVREKVGITWGNPESTPGGKSLKHNCSIRLNFRKTSDPIRIDDPVEGNIPIGRFHKISIEKNRMAPPVLDKEGKSVVFDIPMYYRKYFPSAKDKIIELSRRLKVLKSRLGILTLKIYPNTDKETVWKFEDVQKLYDLLEDENIMYNIYEYILELSSENSNVIIPIEITNWINDYKEKTVKPNAPTIKKGARKKTVKKVDNEKTLDENS